MNTETDATTQLVTPKFSIIRGQSFDVMPIPILSHNAEWFEAGPVTFAVEARLLTKSTDALSGGGGSIHVFSADRTQEYLRFDCFDRMPHYHYLNHAERRNVIWGYDPGSNGPMPQWALRAIEERLPSLLRSAGADELATRVEAGGIDVTVLDRMASAMAVARERTLRDSGMLDEGIAWFDRWREGLSRN
jgi:hypothetical protein